MSRVTKISVEDEPIFGQTTVGTESVKLCEHNERTAKGVLLKADEENTAKVFVGTENVTIETGFGLPAGGSLTLEVENPSILYLVSESESQNVGWVLL